MAEASANAAARSRYLPADIHTQLLAQRTHLISELAGAIDNHFNNIMMAVSSYAELELKKATPAAKRSLEQVLRNAGQATGLIQKLLAFSRYRTPVPQALQLNEVIEGLEDLLQQLAGERFDLVLDLEPQSLRIQSDRVELEQLVLSLAIQIQNAAANSGKLVLSTKCVSFDRAQLRTDEEMPPGKCVTLAVQCLSEETGKSDRPTPARNNQELASDLTLAAIARIVKEAKALLRTGHQSGQGVAFTIYFPAVENQPASQQSLREKSLTSSRTILVVEDDDAVRIPATEFLKMEGFKVLQAKTGVEAISIAQQKRSPVDLLITDIIMPVMSGHQVARELAEMYPGLKVLYMSGDAAHQQSQDDVLQKPFRLDKLNEKIRSLLGE